MYFVGNMLNHKLAPKTGKQVSRNAGTGSSFLFSVKNEGVQAAKCS